MITFEQQITDGSWSEILNGSTEIAFELLGASPIEIYFNESETPPSLSAVGNTVLSFPSGWDFEQTGLIAPTQRIWVKGNNTIRGIR